MDKTYHYSYKKSLPWHIVADLILAVGMLISTDRAFLIKEESFFDIYFAITLVVLSFLHGLVMLFYFIALITERKWWAVLSSLIHLSILVLFVIYSYLLLVLHFGAPSVGEPY